MLKKIASGSLLLFLTMSLFGQEAQKPINQELKEFDEKSSAKVPASLLEAGRKGTEEVRASGILETALNKGGTMPEFTLSDALNKPVRSAELLKKGNLVVVFYRGAW